VRPTADKVRGAIFNILATRGGIAGGRWLDLFAGSGAIAVEALSRGATHVTLVDENREACRVARQNLERAGFGRRADVRRLVLPRGLRALERSGHRFEGAFVDPPYRRGLSQATLRELAAGSLLLPGAIVVVEHASGETLEETYGRSLQRQDTHRYGSTEISLYVNAEET
jgi:16S rRNA (guanine(966)-N(2))-methyltransferase RsmD